MIDRRLLLTASPFLAGLAASANAHAIPADPLRANPRSLPPPVGFSHLSEARGRLIWISGQVPRDSAGNLVGEGDFARQVEQVFENLAVAVSEAGGRFSDVVKLNYYCHESVDRSLLGHVNRMRDRHVDTDRPPASTFVFVPALALPGWLIEIEAIVAIPEDSSLSVHAAIMSDGPISEHVLAATRTLAAATRNEPGCLSYHVAMDIEHPNALRLSETWADVDALRQHFATPHMAAFRDVLRSRPGFRTQIAIYAISHAEPPSILDG